MKKSYAFLAVFMLVMFACADGGKNGSISSDSSVPGSFDTMPVVKPPVTDSSSIITTPPVNDSNVIMPDTNRRSK